MPKLSDTQTILLSTAAQRTNLSLFPLPASHAKAGPRVTQAITGLHKAGLIEERPTDEADATHRTDGDVCYGLFLLTAALTALGIEPQAAPDAAPALSDPTTVGRRVIKAEMVLELLRRDGGATLPELIAATGWLPHTTRAALTGLRKKGHQVSRSKRDGATCYTIEVAA